MNAMRMRERICRLTAALLCLCLVVSAFAGFTEPRAALAEEASGVKKSAPTQNVTRREADPSTMDTYQTVLSFDKNTRYAGRLWTDKSVFAYDSPDQGDRSGTIEGSDVKYWDGKTLTLTEKTDGLTKKVDGKDVGDTKTVTLDTDFLHVYSVLGSSQELTGVPPVRTVIVFDNSGSMYGSATSTDAAWKDQRIAITIESIDRAIDALMMASQYNEVSVVLFGDGANNLEAATGTHLYNGRDTAVTILPMKHYTPSADVQNEYRDKNLSEEGGTAVSYTPYLVGGWNYNTTVDGIENRTGDWNSTPSTTVEGASGSTSTFKTKPDGDNPEQVRFKYQKKTDGELTDTAVSVPSSGWVFVNNTICLLNSDDKTDASNRDQSWIAEMTNGWNDCGSDKYTAYLNGTTNIQAGLYQGMQELLRAEKVETVGSEKYKCVPSMVLLSDGAVTDTVNNWLEPDMQNAMGFVNDFSYKGTSFVGHNDSRGSSDDHTNTAWNQFLAVKRLDGTSPYRTGSGEEASFEAVASADAGGHLTYGAYKYEGTDKDGAEYSNVSSRAEGGSLTAMQALADQYGEDEAYMVLSYLLTAGYYKQAVRHAYSMDEGTDWSVYTITVDMADPSAKGFSAGYENGATRKGGEFINIGKSQITTNPVMMDPTDYFNKEWLESAKYLNEGADVDTPKNTFYDDYTVADVTVEGILKAMNGWQSWLKGDPVGIDTFRSIYSGTSFKSNGTKDKIKTYNADYTYNNNGGTFSNAELTNNGFEHNDATNIFPGPNHDSFYRVYGVQTVKSSADDDTKGHTFYIPTREEAEKAALEAGFKLEDLDYNYVDTAYYAYTSTGTASDLTHVFVEIMDKIMKPLFQPVGGGNDLGVDDAVTYMDPIGKYMDVKDVKGLVLFGKYYGITETAVYNYEFNDRFMAEHNGQTVPGYDKEIEHGVTPFKSGWYNGNDPATAKYGSYHAPKDHPEGDRVPDFTLDGVNEYKSAEDAWADGWVYRLSTEDAQRFVPTLNRTAFNNPSDKQKKTNYTFYRIHISSEDESPRRTLHMNPAYGTDADIPETLKYDDTGEGKHLKEKTGVYALDDLRIWVEDSGDYVDPNINNNAGLNSDASFDEALYINIPANMLPLRTITIDLGKPGDAAGEDWQYTTNTDHDSAGHVASFPLRVFYTVGVSEDILGDGDKKNTIDLTKVGPEYLEQNRASSSAWAAWDGRNMPQSHVEFFSNWYSPTARYSQYATSNTDYSFGDPVVTFSPANDNRYYIFEKALPLYNRAYVWVPEGDLKTDADKETNAAVAKNGLWKRLSVNEDLAEGEDSVYNVDPTSYRGGDLFAQDIEPKNMQGNSVERQKSIWDALGSGTPQEGDIILLKDSLLKDVTRPDTVTDEHPEPFPSEGYFFMALEYYELNKGDHTATMRKHVVVRKGSEFGSAYAAAGINNGDMLVWHDLTGQYHDYPYLSYTTTGDKTRGYAYIGYNDIYTRETDKDGNKKVKPLSDLSGQQAAADAIRKGGTWVVSAKPGGLRVGNMAQDVKSKGDGDGWTLYNDEYIAERFPEYVGNNKEQNYWGFYEDNVTRTANNYLLPTISVNSSVEGGDSRSVVVDVYLGNNGRLMVSDEMLLVTKQYLLTPQSATKSDEGESFLYQLYVQGLTGEVNATEVFYNPYSNSWQRQAAYIDVLTDNASLLLKPDGSRAVFGLNPDNDSAFLLYAVTEGEKTTYYRATATGALPQDASGQPDASQQYTGTIYYYYLPPNEHPTTESQKSTRRIYQDPDYEGEDKIAQLNAGNELWIFYDASKVTPPASGTNERFVPASDDYPAGTFVYGATNGTLVPTSTVDEAGDGWTFRSDASGNQRANCPVIISRPDDVTSASRVKFRFMTSSAYMTRKINFGVNANKDDGGPNPVNSPLEEEDLYDGIIPTGDRKDLFGKLTNEQIAQNTAEFTLKSGEGLLLTGLTNGSTYRFTEKLTEAQRNDGYMLDSLTHVQQEGSQGVYRLGTQTVPVYYHDGATYGLSAPADYQNRETENGLTWAVDQNGSENNQSFRHEEPFMHTNAVMWEYYATLDKTGSGSVGSHHHPVGFAETETANFYLWNGADKTNNAVPGETTVVQPNPSCVTCDEEQSDGTVRHYVYRDGELVDAHYEGEASAYLRGMYRDLVNPTVHFGIEGEAQTGGNTAADTPMPSYVTNTDYTGVYSVFGATGYFEEQAHFVNTRQNVKRETAINGDPGKTEGDGTGRQPGVQVGDTITYEIQWTNTSANTAHVVIIDPLDDGVDFVSAPSVDGHEGKYYATQEAANTALAAIYGGAEKPPQLDFGRVVIWDLGQQPAYEHGAVTLTVKVNADAAEWWDYDGDGTPDERVDQKPDHLVRDQATVRVAENPYTTNIVENPLDEKTEVTPGDGEGVGIGDQIVYQIKWQNDMDGDAWVVVTDPLDPGVDFVSAESDVSYRDKDGNVNTDPGHFGYVESGETKELTDPNDNSKTQLVKGHTVYWDLGLQPKGASGTLTLTVQVNENAKVTYVYTEEQDEPTAGDGTDYKVLDRAEITVGNESHYTNIVENPVDEKKEVTPGNGQNVLVGDGITYQIDWEGNTAAASYVVVMDTLDPGVDYVSSSNGGQYYREAGTLEIKAQTFTLPDGSELTVPDRSFEVPAHTVVWDIGPVAADARGAVTLSVQVNKDARVEYYYAEDIPINPDRIEGGEGEDHKVIDRAKIIVDDTAHFTNLVENPVNEKSELTPGDGEPVGVGEEIVYQIKWRNDTANPAWVVVTDPLDPGVDYLHAESSLTAVASGYVGHDDEPVTLTNGSYTPQTVPKHAAYWDFGVQAAGASGTITLTVRVNKDAKVTYNYTKDQDTLTGGTGTDYKVTDRAEVTVGNESHYTNEVQNPLKDKTETSPGDGENVQIGDPITYEIHWKNDTAQAAYVVVTDTLDPGVTFVSAEWTDDRDPDASKWTTYTLKMNDKSAAGGKIGYFATKQEASYPLNGSPEQGKTVVADHTVFWDIGMVEAGVEGTVTLNVTVNEHALEDHHYTQTDPTLPDTLEGGTGTDYEVVDRAKVSVGNRWRFTNEVRNPLDEKKELTPGEGEPVGVGEEITYEIDWRNDQPGEAYVTVEDSLDPGVDLVSASFDGVTLTWNGNDEQTAGDRIQKSDDVSDMGYQIAYKIDRDPGTNKVTRHVVTWNLGPQKEGASGKVRLTVKVNKDARVTYEYTEEDLTMQDTLTSLPDAKPDYKVTDRAKIIVGHESHYTNEVQNPLKEKVEIDPGDGENVKVGQDITYEIRWKNDTAQKAYVVVTDTLDPGVDFKSAAWTDDRDPDRDQWQTYTLKMKDDGGLDKDGAKGRIDYFAQSGQVSYPLGELIKRYTTDVAPRTVFWDIGEVEAGAEGVVTLTVTVNQDAIKRYEYNETHPELPDNLQPGSEGETDYRVVDRAKVAVGNKWRYTNEVQNPLKEKQELTPGEGVPVGVGRTIDYVIDWENSKGDNAWVVVFDPLDPGVDYVSHGSQQDSSVQPPRASGYVKQGETLTLKSPEGSGFKDIEITGHTVYWDFGLVKANDAGKVTLTVKVNERATVDYNYNESGDGFTGGTGTDNKVTDEATVVVNNEAHVTNEVQNPLNEKKELTPGEGKGVKAGDTVTYQIDWKNSAEEEAYMVVTDTLDPGVDLVSAEWESYTLTRDESGKLGGNAGDRIRYYATKTSIKTSADGTKTSTVADRTVVWDIGTVAPGASGRVTLTIRVNESAKDAYNYTETDADKPDEMQPGDGTDYRIVNRAKVFENGVGHYTNEVDNPLKEKEETSPGDGVSVRPGELISYSIDWAGLEDQSSYVVVTDTLDPGVDLVSAEWESYTLTRDENGVTGGNAGTTIQYYDKGTSVKTSADGSKTAAVADRTVVWDIGTVEAGASGKVTLTVRVKSDGEPEKDYDYGETDPNKPDNMTGGSGKDNQVVNRAKVTVNGVAHYTNKVDNPFGGPDKTETKVDREPYDGIGDINPVALLDYKDPQDVGVSEDDLHLKPGTDDTYVGPRVFPGDRITYEISWENYKSEPTPIIIRDPLDVNVKFIAASFSFRHTVASDGTPYEMPPAGSALSTSLKLIIGDDEKEPNKKPTSGSSDVQVNYSYMENGQTKTYSGPVITYTYDGKTEPAQVVWNLGVQPAGSKGKVTLIVQVLPSATPVGYVDNQAYVKVDGDAEQETRIIENPTPSWQKEEKPYDDENKEGLPFEGEPVQVGDPIHYEIEWYNDQDKMQVVTITDPLDKGVDFTRAWYGDVNDPAVLLTAQDVEAGTLTTGPVTVNENGVDFVVEIAYSDHTVTWTLGTTDDTGKPVQGMPGHSGGFVELDVTVNENAMTAWMYDDGKDSHKESDTEKDHQVVNRAKIQVGDVKNAGEVHYTPVVDNPLPEKTERDPGPDIMVSVGQTVIYDVHWENRYDKPARVIITDPLDDGADFLSASFGGVTLGQNQTEARGKDAYGDVVITYDPLTRTVVWTLENRPAGGELVNGKRPEGSYGDVALQIVVNDKAYQTWTYEKDQDAGKAGEGSDFEIVNRARVQVGDHGAFTSEIENPVPDKQETTPGADQPVVVGQEIVYEIYWKNGHDKEADVLIEDTLDVGLTFKSASDGATYDPRTRTVTWKLPKQPAKAQGHVMLTVKVNDRALQKGVVENTAQVQIGRDPKAKTRVIRNPTKPKDVPDIPMTGDESRPGLWAALALLCAAAMAGTVTLGKRKRDK